jgi:RNA polymerase sigma factor (TIGR02999 family)
MDSPAPNITQLLTAWRAGDQQAMEHLAPILQQELHSAASHYMKGERPGHILQTTALVNEVFLRLIDWKNVEWRNRAQFFAIASQIMRRVLVDYARAQRREKRGGNTIQVSLSDAFDAPLKSASELLDLDEAMQALEKLSPRQSRVVELRFFGGLSLEETAESLKVSVGTVRRDWTLARAWLFRELAKPES